MKELPKQGHMFISYYMVMQSAAGYYIGRYCYELVSNNSGNKDDWCLQPYDRDSGYTSIKEVADEYLEDYELMGQAAETFEEFSARFTLKIKQFRRQLGE